MIVRGALTGRAAGPISIQVAVEPAASLDLVSRLGTGSGGTEESPSDLKS